MDGEDVKNSLFDLAELKELGGYKVGCLAAVDPQLYQKFMMHLNRTVKRDVVTKSMVFLTGVSAYMPEPNNLFLRGESSIGKSYNVVQALKYFPRDDVWLLGGLSPTALIHQHGVLVDKNGEAVLPGDKPDKEASKEEKEAWRQKLKDSRYLVKLKGKILVFLETPHFETFNMLRPILSHDSFEISYRFTDKSRKGQLRTQHVVIQGWPATIFCSTREKYIQDLATRGFTVTPETTREKYQDANVLTGSKAAFPWKFERDSDFMELEGYIRFLKNNLENLKVIVPYGEEFAHKFPNRFPRSMRDFKHILNLIEVSGLFHFAQRPVLVRKVKVEVGENKEVEEHFVMAVRQDYDFVMALWSEIRETTETSAPGHVIKFFHKVVEKVAERQAEFLIQELAEEWNSQFEEKKSSRTIRHWVDFLCDVGYMTKKPNPGDKRSNMLSVIKKKNAESGRFNFAVFFGFDSAKEWLNRVNQILPKSTLLLRENLVSHNETSIEDMFKKYFLNTNRNFGNICLSSSKVSLDETNQEIRGFQKVPQFPNFKVADVLKLERLGPGFQDKCSLCGFSGRMDWQVTFHDKSWGLLCDKCGLILEKQLGEVDRNE